MTMIVIDLPPKRVSIDETRFPDRDTTHIYEHLLHYCSLIPPSHPLPAIDIQVERDSLVVMRGHKYLRIAKHLGRSTVRATIHTADSRNDQEAIAALLAMPDVKQVDWRAILKREGRTLVARDWHVFFFERALRLTEKQAFEAHVVGFFPPLLLRLKPNWKKQPVVTHVEYDDTRNLAQFQAWTPVGVETWFNDYLHELGVFDQRYARIVSYQGRRYFRGLQGAPKS